MSDEQQFHDVADGLSNKQAKIVLDVASEHHGVKTSTKGRTMKERLKHTWSDEKKRKRIILSAITVLVIIAVIGVSVFLHKNPDKLKSLKGVARNSSAQSELVMRKTLTRTAPRRRKPKKINSA